jgi:hypothetical protein
MNEKNREKGTEEVVGKMLEYEVGSPPTTSSVPFRPACGHHIRQT